MLPIIAMMTMLIDHIGFIFFPDNEAYRIIGRIAFPLYCWFLVQGYRYTRDHEKYMRRLFWLACLSQIPYSLALQQMKLNVIFTLLLALAGLYAWERVPSEKWKTLLTAIVIGASLIIPMDYGIYGVLLVFIYHYYERWALIGCHLLLNVTFWQLYGPGYALQLFSLLGSLLIVIPLPHQPIWNRRWLYRGFYPAHLIVLYVVYLWSQN
jgi:hypothetical protein